MPWCEDCAKYWAPSAMTEDGAVPPADVLSRPRRVPITAKNARSEKLAAGDERRRDDEKAPWHFKLLMVMMCSTSCGASSTCSVNSSDRGE